MTLVREKKIPKGGHQGKRLNHDVHVVGRPQVVETNCARDELGAVKAAAIAEGRVMCASDK
jgi:hypothetical protein